MYQPQVETWKGDEVHAYAALSVMSTTNKTTKYGVLWFTAKTEVDKVNRQVTLDDFKITKVKFPTMETKEADYQTFLQAKLPKTAKVIALDRLEASLAASDSEQAGVEALPVNNDPPKVIFTTKPSLLVLIDGPPRYRDVGGTALKLMLNTQATILLDPAKNEYYLNVMDGWLQAPDLMAGPWTYASKIPDDMKEITKGIHERQQSKAPEGTAPPSLKQAKKDGKVPEIYVTWARVSCWSQKALHSLSSLRTPNWSTSRIRPLTFYETPVAAITTFFWRDDGSDRNRWRGVLGSLLTERICLRSLRIFPKAVPKLASWYRSREPALPKKHSSRMPFRRQPQ
jgi:hypothetical protein